MAARGKGPQRLRVGVRSPARTRLLVLLVEFFNHLGRLPSAQTHRNRPRRRSRRAEEAAGRPAPCSGAGWVAVPSLGEKARPPRLSRRLLSPGPRPRPPTPPARRGRGRALDPGDRVPAPGASARSGDQFPAQIPAHPPAIRQLTPDGDRMRFYLVGTPWIATSQAPQSLEAEARGPNGLFSLNESEIFYNPLLGPSIAEGALSWRGSGGFLFQER